MKIIIDAGHGWNTRGKRSPDFDCDTKSDMKENYFNQSMANKLNFALDQQGIESELLNPYYFDMPLRERIKREHKIADKESILISIHADAWTNEKANGQTIFYKSKEAKKLAEHFMTYSPFLPKVSPKRGMKRANYMILRESKSIAILIEFGFMTNRNDLRSLMSQIEQNKAVHRLTQTILAYEGGLV